MKEITRRDIVYNLNKFYKIEVRPAFTTITTPFLDINGEEIVVYLTLQANGKYILSEDGWIIDMAHTNHHKISKKILHRFNARLKEGALEVVFDDLTDLNIRIRDLIQACVLIVGE